MKQHQARIERYPLATFVVLAYTLSWSIQIPLALQSQGLLSTHIPYGLHYLSGFGPLVAAMVVTGCTVGKQGLRDLTGRMLRWRVGIGWWAVALSPLIALILLSVVLKPFQPDTLSVDQLGQIDYFPNIGLGALFFWILTFGLGEETGWRGFALPHLQQKRKALSASLILWIIWSVWHLPLFFYMYDFSILTGLLIGLLAGTIVFTWIYNSTGGSVLLSVIWHGLFNFATACTTCKTGVNGAVISSLVMVWAVLIVLFYRPTTLAQLKMCNRNGNRKKTKIIARKYFRSCDRT